MKIKIYTIFMVLFLTQAAFGRSIDTSKSVESSEENKELTPKQLILVYTATRYLNLTGHFLEKAVNKSRLILQDESLLANEQPQVLEFKQNLTKLVEKYDTTDHKSRAIWKVLNMYGDTTNYYFKLPPEQQTAESKFILDILKEYKIKDLELELEKEFDPLIKEIKQFFAKAKEQLDQPMLDWYEKFKTLTDFGQQQDAFIEFFELSKQ